MLKISLLSCTLQDLSSHTSNAVRLGGSIVERQLAHEGVQPLVIRGLDVDRDAVRGGVIIFGTHAESYVYRDAATRAPPFVMYMGCPPGPRTSNEQCLIKNLLNALFHVGGTNEIKKMIKDTYGYELQAEVPAGTYC